MATHVGGLRARLVHDNAFDTIQASLLALGWMGAGRQHLPLNFVPDVVPPTVEVPLNTISLTSTGTDSDDLEMGSNWAEDRTTFYVDIYAESAALGRHLAYDIRDILRGKVPSIGRERPVVEVRDLAGPDPSVIVAIVEVLDVVVDRSMAFSQPWQRNWWVVRFDLSDPYGDEDDV